MLEEFPARGEIAPPPRADRAESALRGTSGENGTLSMSVGDDFCLAGPETRTMTKTPTALLTTAAAVLLAAGSAWGQFDSFDTPARAPKVGVKARASHTHVTGGQTFHVAAEITITEGWIYYSPDPGRSDKLTVYGAAVGAQAGGRKLNGSTVLWPPDTPHEYSFGGETHVNHAYEGRIVAYVPVTVPADAPPGDFRIRLTLDGQVCSKDACDPLPDASGPDAIASETTVQVAAAAQVNPAWPGHGLPKARTAAQLAADHAAAAAKPKPPAPAANGAANLTVWAGLGLAMLAGLVLNVMPCVLPVIPIRILSIVNMAGEDKRRIVTLGLAFAGGIVLFFVGLGLLNVVLRLALGQAFDLGQHFSYPAVRIALALVVVALAANMFGAFNVIVPSKIAGLGQGAEGRETHLKSVSMGVMMAVLSTPCSFAFLAAALTWAQVQPLWLGTLAIVLIGVGMAAPHALLVAWPDLLRKMPRPGRWMELFKQSMGFLMLPVAIWLFATLGEETYPFWVAAYAVVLAFCLWVWGTWVRYDAPLSRKLIVRGAAVALAVAAAFWMLRPPKPLAVTFENYDPVRLQALRKAGKPVLLKFTATWCLKCYELDEKVYDQADVARELQDRKIAALKADVSQSDSAANKLLRTTFRGQPPLTVIYPAGNGPPQLLQGTYTKADLLKALDAAGAQTTR